MRKIIPRVHNNAQDHFEEFFRQLKLHKKRIMPQKKKVSPSCSIICHGMLMFSAIKERCGFCFKRIPLIAPLQKKRAPPVSADNKTPPALHSKAFLRFSDPPAINAEINTPIKASTRIIINAAIFHLLHCNVQPSHR